jgi:hypothetical protein
VGQILRGVFLHIAGILSLQVWLEEVIDFFHHWYLIYPAITSAWRMSQFSCLFDAAAQASLSRPYVSESSVILSVGSKQDLLQFPTNQRFASTLLKGYSQVFYSTSQQV